MYSNKIIHSYLIRKKLYSVIFQFGDLMIIEAKTKPNTEFLYVSSGLSVHSLLKRKRIKFNKD